MYKQVHAGINICIHLIQKRLSSEVLHCALRIQLHTQTAKHHRCNELQVPPMRQQYSCIIYGGNVEQNAFPSCHATMYKFVTSMVLCGLGIQQCAMHNATIQKTTFFELGVCMYTYNCVCMFLCIYVYVRLLLQFGECVHLVRYPFTI